MAVRIDENWTSEQEEQHQRDEFEALRAALIINGGAQACAVSRLREIVGNSRMGTEVSRRIAEQLTAHRIGYLPTAIPHDQNASLLLYVTDRPYDLGYLIAQIRELAVSPAPTAAQGAVSAANKAVWRLTTNAPTETAR